MTPGWLGPGAAERNWPC